MIAFSCAKWRSVLAKQIGLGTKPRDKKSAKGLEIKGVKMQFIEIQI